MQKSLNIEPLLLRNERSHLAEIRGVKNFKLRPVTKFCQARVQSSVFIFFDQNCSSDMQTLVQKAFLRQPTTTMTFVGYHRFTKVIHRPVVLSDQLNGPIEWSRTRKINCIDS